MIDYAGLVFKALKEMPEGTWRRLACTALSGWAIWCVAPYASTPGSILAVCGGAAILVVVVHVVLKYL